MATTENDILYDSTTFRVLCTCYALLALKILLMALLTVRQRFSKKPEKEGKDGKVGKGSKVKSYDIDIERIKRAHLNDLENIPIFIFTSFWYAALKPEPLVAILLIITYTLARFGHSYVYAIKVVKQPARFLCYALGYVITGYMAVYVILSLKD